MLRAKDVMRTKVVSVGPQATLAETARLFAARRISGAPVLGPRRKLLGVVSQTDLLRRHRQEDEGEVPAFYKDGECVKISRGLDSAGEASVAEVMTPAALCAQEETPVDQLASFMLARRVHRVLFTRKGALRGIVTSMDLLRIVAGVKRRTARA